MADALKTFILETSARQQATLANQAAREMAKHCDARIKRMRKALKGIDTFAWSVVSLPPPAAKALQKRVDACRSALMEDLA